MDTRRLPGNIRSWCLAAAVILASAAIAASEGDNSVSSPDQCLSCHREYDVLPDGFLAEDVHLKAGLTCAGCHGGDATSADQERAMSPAAGFVGVPARNDIPGFCGKCHSDIEFMRRFQPRIPTDQVQQYETSVHGQRLAKGDKNVAECVSCHTAHGVLAANDARSPVYPINVPLTCKKCHSDPDYMRGYDIPTDQYAKYAGSVHGVALLENQDTGSPACNDCHGNHGAAPPNVESVRQVCGHCHVNNMQYFRASAMGRAFEREKLHDCEECHGNHEVQETTIDMVGVGSQSVCVRCHAQGDKGYDVAKRVYDDLQGLVAAYEEAEAQRAEVSRKGMDDVEIGVMLRESHQDLIQARTLVHTFDPAQVSEKTDAGIEKARDALNQAIALAKEYRFRRQGFGLATILITLLVVLLYVKIRQMEGK